METQSGESAEDEKEDVLKNDGLRSQAEEIRIVRFNGSGDRG